MWTSLALGVVAHSCVVTAFDYSIKVSSPASVPASASWNIPHDFASFSLPAHFFADYAGRYMCTYHGFRPEGLRI